jgi:CHASE3 domain sensor protein
MRSLLSSRLARLINAFWLVVPLALICWSAYLTFQSQKTLAESIESVHRTFDAQRNLRLVQTSLTDAETGQRGFLLTSREAYLAPFNQALEELPSRIQNLRSTTEGDTILGWQLDELGSLITFKLDELGQTVRLAKAGDMPAALALVKSDRGKEAMDKIRVILGQMMAQEERLLADRNARYAFESRAHTRIAVILVAGSGAFAVMIAVLLYRLRCLDPLVKICAWSRAIEYKGEWISFEEYLDRRFGLKATHGISPLEAEKLQQTLEETVSERR